MEYKHSGLPSMYRSAGNTLDIFGRFFQGPLRLMEMPLAIRHNLHWSASQSTNVLCTLPVCYWQVLIFITLTGQPVTFPHTFVLFLDLYTHTIVRQRTLCFQNCAPMHLSVYVHLHSIIWGGGGCVCVPTYLLTFFMLICLMYQSALTDTVVFT